MSSATQPSPADVVAHTPSLDESRTNADQDDEKLRRIAEGVDEDDGERREGADDDEEEEEEQLECGFCLFMKGGGCKDSFVDWEKCIEEAESNKEDMIDRCAEVTRLLRDCMLRHADYYEPILSAEKAMEDGAARELDQEEAASSATAEEGAVPSNMTEDIATGLPSGQ